MIKQAYEAIERYMVSGIAGSAHDKEHIYRVLYVALDIAQYEENDVRLIRYVNRGSSAATPCSDNARAYAPGPSPHLRHRPRTLLRHHHLLHHLLHRRRHRHRHRQT